MTATNDFPTTGVELRYLLVVSDYARSLTFYQEVLGARVVRQISDVLCLLSLGGSELLLTFGGDPTSDKPTMTFAPPADPATINSELNIRVQDCLAAYQNEPRMPPCFNRGMKGLYLSRLLWRA
jgi:hypothetical protein